jgi:hypothetical protein
LLDQSLNSTYRSNKLKQMGEREWRYDLYFAYKT